MYQFNERHLIGPGHLSSILRNMEEAGILTEEHFNMVVANEDDDVLDLALSTLHRAQALNTTNFRAAVHHRHPYSLVSALITLMRADLLTDELRHFIIEHEDNPRAIASAIVSLAEASLLTPKNIASLAGLPHIASLSSALSHLHASGIATQEHFEQLTRTPRLDDLLTALSTMSDIRLLTPENFICLTEHEKPNIVGYILVLLSVSINVTQRIFELVMAHPSLDGLSPLISLLVQRGLLTEANLEALLDPMYSVLYHPGVIDEVWHRIPEHNITQENFNRLLIASLQDDPLGALADTRDRIIAAPFPVEIEREELVAEPFNPAQSTHTASVHRSTSDSARKLLETYGSHIHFDEKIEEVRAFVLSLDDSPKNAAAKRCVHRLTSNDYSSADASGVSLTQLLALVYCAILDDTKRIDANGTAVRLEDAKEMFIQGLYEIQRGYNIDENHQDDGQSRDRPICVGGAFNKLIESINGIHRDVHIIYVNHAGACAKFPIIAKSIASAYLARIALTEDAISYQQVRNLLDHIKSEGSLEPIWHLIAEEVKASVWEEFKEAYDERHDHPLLNDLMQQGIFLEAPSVLAFEVQLLASPGAAIHHRQQEGREREQLWANRHISAQAQHQFDKTFGLVLLP